jgi:hypothetical protein
MPNINDLFTMFLKASLFRLQLISLSSPLYIFLVVKVTEQYKEGAEVTDQQTK